MDKKNITIVILVIALGMTIYLVFYGNQISQRESPATNAISPDKELKAAYEESSQYSIAELFCFPTSRFDCGSGSCTPSVPATYFLVDYGTESGTYFRCDTKGCDPYSVEVNQSGEFTQFIPSQGQAMLFRVATGDVLGNKGDFVDIVTLGTGAIVSTGKCEFRK